MQQAGCTSRLVLGGGLPSASLSGRPGIQACQIFSAVAKPPGTRRNLDENSRSRDHPYPRSSRRGFEVTQIADGFDLFWSTVSLGIERQIVGRDYVLSGTTNWRINLNGNSRRVVTPPQIPSRKTPHFHPHP